MFIFLHIIFTCCAWISVLCLPCIIIHTQPANIDVSQLRGAWQNFSGHAAISVAKTDNFTSSVFRCSPRVTFLTATGFQTSFLPVFLEFAEILFCLHGNSSLKRKSVSQGCRYSLADKTVYCSCRGPQLHFQHPFWVAHNQPLQHQGNQYCLLSFVLGNHTHLGANMCAYTTQIKNILVICFMYLHMFIFLT